MDKKSMRRLTKQGFIIAGIHLVFFLDLALEFILAK